MNDVDPRCAAFEEDLSALLDGELEAARATAVRSHADACAACARRLAALRAVDAALGDFAAAPLRGEETRLAALHARLAGPGRADTIAPRRAPPRRRRWLLPAAAGAVAAAASALFTLLRPAPEPTPVARERGVTIVAETSEPTPAAPAPFAKEGLGAGRLAGHGASAPADEMPAAAPDEAIDAADVEVVALLDVLDPEPRELRGSQSRDERNRARWLTLRDDAREALREEWRRFLALAPAEREARLRERSAP